MLVYERVRPWSPPPAPVAALSPSSSTPVDVTPAAATAPSAGPADSGALRDLARLVEEREKQRESWRVMEQIDQHIRVGDVHAVLPARIAQVRRVDRSDVEGGVADDAARARARRRLRRITNSSCVIA